MKIKLGLLMGGSSAEREVSNLSAQEMLRNIDHDKYEIIPFEITETNADEWIGEMLRNKPDVVISGLHGGLGENGAVQGLMECLGIPYVGSKVLSSAVCMDKSMSKLIMRAHHIPVPDDVLVRYGSNVQAYVNEIEALGFPLVVKPNNGGSSIGVTIVGDMTELLTAVESIKRYCGKHGRDDILIEKYIAGQEVTCGIIENEKGLEVLTVLDIDAAGGYYDYDAKYFSEMTKIEYSQLPDFLQTMIAEIAKKVFTVLRCTGYGRVDMIVQQEQVYVLEINTLPGMTSHSLIPKAARGKNISYVQLLDYLIEYERKSALINNA